MELEFKYQLRTVYSSHVLFPNVCIISEGFQIKFIDIIVLRHVPVFVRCAIPENTVLLPSCNVVVTLDSLRDQN